MGTPRRVPWASNVELAELHSLIFSPSANESSLRCALSRISIYVASPSCPTFLHLLHALVTAYIIPHPPRSSHDADIARMTYAMTVVRFVNGMVDPLQTGFHARPISHLAASLGLSPGMVGLRHRATHEDLPPLELLRRAIEQALDYVHRNSFLPLLASTSAELATGWSGTRCESLVWQWKQAMKSRIRSREVRKESEIGRELDRLRRQLELEDIGDVSDAIVRIGLVPVARKKRPGRRATTPTRESILIWAPLLSHLTICHPSFMSALCEHIVTALIHTTVPELSHFELVPVSASSESSTQRRELASYRWTLGTWLIWLWDATSTHSTLYLESEYRPVYLRRIACELIHGDEVLHRIYHLLAVKDGDAPVLSMLLPNMMDNKGVVIGKDESEDELQGLLVNKDDGLIVQEAVDVVRSLSVMETNLCRLEKMLATSTTPLVSEHKRDCGLVFGWREEDQFRHCPIGLWM